MSLHKEISFENEICDSLAANGWLYAEGDASQYDRTRVRRMNFNGSCFSKKDIIEKLSESW